MGLSRRVILPDCCEFPVFNFPFILLPKTISNLLVLALADWHSFIISIPLESHYWHSCVVSSPLEVFDLHKQHGSVHSDHFKVSSDPHLPTCLGQ